MPKKKRLYFITDLETVGPVPLVHSMLSFASQAMTEDGKYVGPLFWRNLKPLPGSLYRETTMLWWNKHIVAWQDLLKNQFAPGKAMRDLAVWVDLLCGDEYTPILASDAVHFEWAFLSAYGHQYLGRDIFDRDCLSLPTLIGAKAFGEEWTRMNYHRWPKRWLSDFPHTHIARDDVRKLADSCSRIFPELLMAA